MLNMLKEQEYSIDYQAGGDTAVLHGVMRLASAAAYDAAFTAIRQRVEQGGALRIDLVDAAFMNSSGIRALASLVLLAKAKGAAMSFVASEKVPWQKKTMASLRGINDALVVDLR
jgi:hypothetical protein